MKTQKKSNYFNVFWEAYPLKRDRIAADRVWQKMPLKDRRAALAGIDSYRQECQRTGANMMYPANYLSHRRWEDEPMPVDAEPPVQPAASDVALAEMDVW